MAKIPTLERLYECGEVLANAKGLTHKVFTVTLKFRVRTHFRAVHSLYVPRLTGRSMRRSYLVFKEMISARGSVRSSLEGGTSFSFEILENEERGDDLFFLLLRFFPHFPDLCQQSIDAMLDLCEDVNTMIRMQVASFLFCCFFV